MTFAEKANLAKQYLDIFETHHIVFITFGIIIVIIGLILGCKIATFIHKDDFESLALDILMALCIICGAATIIAGSCADTPQYGNDHKTYPDAMQLDTNIVHMNHWLPIYQHRAKVDYQKSLKFRGAKKYCVDHAYCKAHHHALADKEYLQSHKPKSPWING